MATSTIGKFLKITSASRWSTSQTVIIDVDKYNSIVNYKDEVEVEMTIDELNAFNKK